MWLHQTSLVLLISLALLFVSIKGTVAQNNYTNNKERVFKAGAFKSNITPPLGLPIVGNFNEPLAENIHDDLYARCLVLDDGETKLAIVLVDNVGVPKWTIDEAKRLIEESSGLPPQQVLIAAVHDHSAVSAGGLGIERRGWGEDKPLDEYQRFLIHRIADGVKNAINRLESARIGWGTVNIPEHLFNRRYLMKDSVRNPFGGWEKAKMNPGVGNPDVVEPAGGTDPEMSFISLQSLEGQPIALLANYSLHYVGGVPKGDISGDYFGVFADHIQKLLGADRQDPAFVGIMSNGTSGDVNNIDVLGKRKKQYSPYEKMRIVAEDVAEKIFEAHQKINFNDWVKLDSRLSELTLRVRRGTPEMFANIQKILARSDTAKPLFHPLEKIYAQRVANMAMEWPNEIKVPIQTLSVGNLGIAAAPFEVFTETGLEIKRKSPYQKTFTIEIANGYFGYLPTPRQHKLGGYETWLSTNLVEEDTSDKLVLEWVRLFSEMKQSVEK